MEEVELVTSTTTCHQRELEMVWPLFSETLYDPYMMDYSIIKFLLKAFVSNMSNMIILDIILSSLNPDKSTLVFCHVFLHFLCCVSQSQQQ